MRVIIQILPLSTKIQIRGPGTSGDRLPRKLVNIKTIPGEYLFGQPRYVTYYADDINIITSTRIGMQMTLRALKEERPQVKQRK